MEAPSPKKPQYKQAVISILFAWVIALLSYMAYLLGYVDFTYSTYLPQTFSIAIIISLLGLVNIIVSAPYLIWPIFYFEKKLSFIFKPWASLFYGVILGTIAGVLSPLSLFLFYSFSVQSPTFNPLTFSFALPFIIVGAFIGGLSIFIYTRLCYEKQRLFSPPILWTSFVLTLLSFIVGSFAQH